MVLFYHLGCSRGEVMDICKGLGCAVMKLVKQLKSNVGAKTTIPTAKLSSCCFVSLALLFLLEARF